MNFNQLELNTVEHVATEQTIKELGELELALVGGGCGDPILA